MGGYCCSGEDGNKKEEQPRLKENGNKSAEKTQPADSKKREPRAEVQEIRNSQKLLKEELETLRREKVELSTSHAEKVRALQTQIQELNELEKRQQENIKIFEQKKQLQQQHSKTQEELTKLKEKYRQLEKDSESTNAELKKSIRDREEIENQKAREIESKLAILNEKEEKEKQRKLMEENLQMEKQLKSQAEIAKLQLEKERISIVRKNESLQKDKQQLSTTVSLLKQAQIDNQQQLKHMKLALRLSSMFSFSILCKKEDYKQFLVNTLQRHLSRSIRQTNLIYHYDPQNKINFHKYIDNHPYFVIIIALKNGFLLAGYSQGGFNPKQPSDRDGLLISLTNRKVFLLAEKNRRAVTYDDFYIIMGNSELRIKSQDDLLFSNFAISNGYFNAKGEKVGALMGGGTNERELPMDGYECYALQLHESLLE